MMDYNVVINGIPVEAHYSAHAVGEIFVPLLKKLTELQKKGEKEDQLRKRLIDRRVKTGVEEKASAEFVDFSSSLRNSTAFMPCSLSCVVISLNFSNPMYFIVVFCETHGHPHMRNCIFRQYTREVIYS